MIGKRRDTSRSSSTVARFLACLLVASAAVAETDFSDIYPVLQSRCIICHSGPAAPLGLRLDSRDAVLAGSSRGAIVVAGDPAASELIKRIEGTSLPQMPMTGPPYLTAEEVALFRQWILDGMPDGAVPEPPAVASSGQAPSGPVLYDRVAPILAQRCVKCHTEGGLMATPPEGYRLGSYAETVSPRDRVRVVPGSPGASELVRRIRGQSLPRMPYDGPPFLTGEEIDLIEQWIADGARDSSGAPASVPVGGRVRLQGRLASPNRLDDVELVITRTTRIDKSPGRGDYVEVRGRIDADGRVVVERMRRR